MKKRIAALLLCVVLLISLIGCGKQNEVPEDNFDEGQSMYVGDGISLACNTADSFNPYKAATGLNRLLCTLLYDTLVQVDNEYKAVNVLADSVTVDGKVCTVKLKTALFSDGTQVTAQDVAYSFNLAKGSPNYSAKLSGISLQTPNDTKTLIFVGDKNDAYAANLLTFPIIKRESDLLVNQDNVELPPIGSGRYVIDSAFTSLNANEKYHLGATKLKTVKLINTPDEEALSHAIEIGAVDMYYTDLSDCNILRMSGERVNTELNNLVYIGVNLNKSILQSDYMRHGLSAALNRKKICEDAYYNNAVPATGVFNPAWKAVEGIQSIQITGKSEISIENFGKIGYNKKNNEGFFVNASNHVIELRLLVNKENTFRTNAAQLIASQLAQVGIKINIESVPYNQYVARLKAGQFDLYLAEVNINANMDLTQLLCTGGTAAYGIPAANSGDNADTVSLEQIVHGFYNGDNTVSDIAAMAVSELPIIPVCYRTGILFCSNEIANPFVNSSNDIYGVLGNLVLE